MGDWRGESDITWGRCRTRVQLEEKGEVQELKGESGSRREAEIGPHEMMVSTPFGPSWYFSMEGIRNQLRGEINGNIFLDWNAFKNMFTTIYYPPLLSAKIWMNACCMLSLSCTKSRQDFLEPSSTPVAIPVYYVNALQVIHFQPTNIPARHLHSVVILNLDEQSDE